MGQANDSFVKKAFRPIANFSRKVTYKLMRDVIGELQTTIVSQSRASKNNKIEYSDGGLIRVIFLFQVASFWPNWESFYLACKNDSRFDVKLVLLDELYGDITQMLTARQFLDEQGLEYEVYSNSLFTHFLPHIVVMQTPYDFGHRRAHTRSAAFKAKGARIVYIPYGIELADTAHARDAHFYNQVVLNAWRVFTFSERMREDYRLMCPNASAVKCLGHPKFDALYHREQIPQRQEIQEKAKGRPVLVWHVHFPKLVPQPDGSEEMSTPKLEVYLQFAEYITGRSELFVVLQPHPKFLDGEGDLGVKAKEIVSIMEKAENACVDWADDYRNTLVNCDWFITDRSALMVEVDCTGVPVLYMYNQYYVEPLTPAIMPIMDSYYQGTSFEEMKAFVEQCVRGEDPKKEERFKAFRETIPYFDGKCGERIKNHIAQALLDETHDPVMDKLAALEDEVRELRNKLEEIENR